MQHYSRFTDKGPSKAERFFRTICSLLKKPIFIAGKASWINELASVFKQYNNTIHGSIKMTPIEASKNYIKKNVVYNKLKQNRRNRKPKFKLGDSLRTTDIRSVFSKGDSTIYSYKIYTITEVTHCTLASYRINYLPERYNQNLLIPTELLLEQNNQFMKKLFLFQQ